MRTVKQLHRSVPEEEDDLYEDFDGDDDLPRVLCPGCARAVALDPEDGVVPQHAVCPSPWDPFGLTVCPGSGHAADAEGLARVPVPPLVEPVTLAALPDSLHWRLQPFSHATGPDAAEPRVETLRTAA
ncbi:hypothetical protein [Streptomyces sp. RFCAC02]|uniref:hypothetical protein n=1 Tax=Streptomyces sp. RFCAC02 TaxID=2499143 RepID=UPI0010227F97|nr:hypothetical protein [Streptomyces sp. RFCAC02]